MYEVNVNQQDSSVLSRVNEVIPSELEVSAIANLYEDNPVESNQNFTKLPSEQRLEHWLGNILKYGVLLSSAIVFIGGVLYLIRHGTEPANYHIFQGEPAVFRSPGGVVTAILSGQRRGIIQLGILLLIATPIVRVAFSVLAFIRERDFSYIILTLIVLSGLIYSFIGAYY
ncbi:MAG TPA: DUF1634 domain-containing protein [Cyanobacteria bacterium UBA12227]|nr:DUF1634 domain-containing protein [Cyanobacteria bacterium UBA12227]HAX86819.1 DUF1634 domain-containing protein [Cyanobacteria bacterium UBA11370]HBY78368.1 DUF1634 domain-containing protein [Cyanobacteria bacterium UBA11148]